MVSVMLYPCMFYVALSMDLFGMCVACLTVFANCFGETIRNMFDEIIRDCCSLLWSCLVWVEVLWWIDHVWLSKECVCCACDPSVRLDAPSRCLFVFMYVGSDLLV